MERFRVGWRDGGLEEEADWGPCRDGGRSLDGGRPGGGGGGECFSDIFGESANVEGRAGEGGGCGEDAGAEGEA